MRELEITEEMLSAGLVGFTCDYIAGSMLFSDDDKKRDEFLETSVAQYQVRTAGQAPPLRRVLDKHMGGQIWAQLANAMPPRYWLDNNPEVKAAFCGGVFTGMIYGPAIWENHLYDGRFSLDAHKKLAVERAKRAALPIGRAKLHDLLQPSAASLWAAFIWRWDNGERDGFPCRPDALRDFLGAAQWFQAWGLRIRQRNQSRSLFSPEKLWRVPNLELVIPYALTDGEHVWALPAA